MQHIFPGCSWEACLRDRCSLAWLEKIPYIFDWGLHSWSSCPGGSFHFDSCPFLPSPLMEGLALHSCSNICVLHFSGRHRLPFCKISEEYSLICLHKLILLDVISLLLQGFSFRHKAIFFNIVIRKSAYFDQLVDSLYYKFDIHFSSSQECFRKYFPSFPRLYLREVYYFFAFQLNIYLLVLSDEFGSFLDTWFFELFLRNLRPDV